MYYYLLSSLPYLTETSDYFPSMEEFLSACSQQMSLKDFETVSSARIEKYEELAETGGVLADWAKLEMALRNEIARERTRKTQLNYDPYAAEGASWYRERIAQAFQAPSPLTTEQMMLAIRFELFSELEAGKFFTLDNVILYFIKLQLLQRMKQMNRSRGEESFEAAYKTIQAPLNNEGGLSVGV